MATTYLPRSAWTSTSRGGARQIGADLVGLVAHYTGVSRSYAGLGREQVARVLRGIRRYHTQTRGWSDIGYSVAIDHAGRVWDLRGITRVPAAHASAANPRANWHRSAVLLLLGVGDEPTDAMIQAFRDFRRGGWLDRWPGATDLLGHRDVPGASTSCPGDPAAALVADGTLLGQPDGSGGGGTASDWSEEIIMALPYVERGDRGGDVRRVQGLCIAHGGDARKSIETTGGVDGIAGAGTDRAIRAVQQQQAPPVDGIVGPITWRALLDA